MRRVAVVPHTHWDREWYEPYQVFRHRLVHTLDALVALLEADPSYAHFLLDGQMAVVDDYLEVRPEAEDRLRALVAAGRLSVGPWYVLCDEFLVSGETIVRDLELGLAAASRFGGAMEVGYLPDMFGHVAQMPQLLTQAGFRHAVVWRGVPSDVTTTGFWWASPDGSVVRAEYLPVGYANGAALPEDAKALLRRVADLDQELGDFLVGPLLLMNGSDHLPPQPRLGQVVAEANALSEDHRLEITSLSAYLEQAPTEGLSSWSGELRSGARANLLMGVTSNRIDVKQAEVTASVALERRAEPLAALFLDADAWPRRLLELSWLGLVRNAAHDSICACSVDEVIEAVLHRYHESHRIADNLAADALGALGSSMATPGPVVVNPAARPRHGLVELVLMCAEAPPDTQLVSTPRALPGTMVLDANTFKTVLAMIQGAKVDNDTFIHGVSVEEDDDGLEVRVALGADQRPVDIAQAKQELYARLGARPESSVRVHLQQPAMCKVVARTEEIPGFGWRRFSPAPLRHPVTAVEPPGAGAGAGVLRLSNGLVTAEVEPLGGTFSLNGVAGYGRLVDGGDLGDSYNYSPPANDEVVRDPVAVATSVKEAGPVRAVGTIESRYLWPDHVEEGSQRRVGRQEVVVTTTLELRADEPALRVEHRFVNPSRDHRLRVHLPLPEPAPVSHAECAFGVVERGLVAEGRPEEYGLATFPSRRFVVAGGLTVCHLGLHEYELVDLSGDGGDQRASTLALTVLRSTGMLSRLGMAFRPFPAGPLTPVEALQRLGRPVEARYMLASGDHDPFALADDLLVPLETLHAHGGGGRPDGGSALTVTGAEVSSVRRVAGQIEVRVYNPSGSSTAVGVKDRSGWLLDLRGRPLTPFDGGFELRPFGIATARLSGS